MRVAGGRGEGWVCAAAYVVTAGVGVGGCVVADAGGETGVCWGAAGEEGLGFVC